MIFSKNFMTEHNIKPWTKTIQSSTLNYTLFNIEILEILRIVSKQPWKYFILFYTFKTFKNSAQHKDKVRKKVCSFFSGVFFGIDKMDKLYAHCFSLKFNMLKVWQINMKSMRDSIYSWCSLCFGVKCSAFHVQWAKTLVICLYISNYYSTATRSKLEFLHINFSVPFMF